MLALKLIVSCKMVVMMGSMSSTKMIIKITVLSVEDAGLEVDGALEDGGDGVNFIKLHAPLGTLKKYAEILKMKLPLKVRYNL